MDPVSSAIGVIAAIPQCIEAAKQLYDLRERFDQAAILITAIYTESMVVAASLSQIQSLLQGTTLQNKPELRNTLDQALTGCWVVYQCLDEEVRDLARKVDVNDLRKRDRARFLLKEANFKELLQQIRGQQSALGLLIQGLQMESLSDMHRLLGDNSVKLDQIAKRSTTLRQKHPNIKVPESVLDKDTIDDSQTIFGDAEFTFDDEVVNSKAYRRAMARALTESSINEKKDDVIDLYKNTDKQVDDQQVDDTAAADMRSLLLRLDDAIESNNNDEPPPYENEGGEAHADILDDLEKSMLPFMPPASTSRQPSVIVTEAESMNSSQEQSSLAMTESTTSITALVAPLSEEPEEIQGSSDVRDSGATSSQRSLDATDENEEDEKPPPLPPRRSAQSFLAPAKSSSTCELKKVSSWDQIFAPLSTTSSLSLTDPGLGDNTSPPNNQVIRKPLPLLVKKPSNLSFYGTDYKDIASPTSEGETHPGKIWASILLDEEKYIERLGKFTNIFYGLVVKEWPVLEKHMEAIVLARQLMPLHQEHILDVVKERSAQNAYSICDPRVFITWASKTYRVLKEYSRRYPHALYALRLTRTRDKKFAPCVESLGLSLTYFGKNWEDYLVLPIVQLDTYITRLQSIARWLDESTTPVPIKEQSRIKATLETLQRLQAQCSDLTEKSMSQEEMQSLHRRIHTVDTSLLDPLELSAPARRIIYQGVLAFKHNNRGPWQSMQVILLDNYVLWGKVKSAKDPKHKGMKADSVRVIEKPVPVTHIAIRLPVGSAQIRKTSYLDEFPRGVALYELFIDVVVTQSNFTTHCVGALSSEERNHWYQKLSEVAGTTPPEI
ncbi:uncharacterized protein N0V89_005611 [Didymosphaeria variabile]|uniref:DH domain-containing protein n=1 Tax=Didymosphaeria variabile TaxID=1932322 RepID=A0A9W8XLC1_9PLEO|nr:uncharacterized protein N0V89_005611 [Didymosphaeria variabile]KAJ4353881.1 hypothetical protein N0V89_005611 [Didymosphaeria variabile]